MKIKNENYTFIKNDKEWQKFLEDEKLLDNDIKSVKKAKIKGWIKIAFWFLRVYIVIMVILVLLGFLHIL
ncbi:MAG: hypothetical protein ACP5NL_02885 [Thermoplasmata archaeon]